MLQAPCSESFCFRERGTGLKGEKKSSRLCDRDVPCCRVSAHKEDSLEPTSLQNEI